MRFLIPLLAAAFFAGVVVGLAIAGGRVSAHERWRPAAWSSLPCAAEMLGREFVRYTCPIEEASQ